MNVCTCAPDCDERIHCDRVGAPGHAGCGWCDDHDQARHLCLCRVVVEGGGPDAA